MIRHICNYVINDHLYLYAECLIQMEMYNDSVAIPFLKKKKKKRYTLLCPNISEKYYIHFFLQHIRYVYKSFIILNNMLYDMR